MDKYYGNVCELDIIFNFQKAYFILDELLLAGELQESSKKNVLRCISQQDSLEDMEVSICFHIPMPMPIPYPIHYTLYPVIHCESRTGLILPRSRKMWSPRSCSGILCLSFVASILINTTIVLMSGYRRSVTQPGASGLIVFPSPFSSLSPLSSYYHLISQHQLSNFLSFHGSTTREVTTPAHWPAKHVTSPLSGRSRRAGSS
jgi:hypothetical protein